MQFTKICEMSEISGFFPRSLTDIFFSFTIGKSCLRFQHCNCCVAVEWCKSLANLPDNSLLLHVHPHTQHTSPIVPSSQTQSCHSLYHFMQISKYYIVFRSKNPIDIVSHKDTSSLRTYTFVLIHLQIVEAQCGSKVGKGGVRRVGKR